MDNLTSLVDREKRFEEAHCTCKELMEESINRIDRFSSRWLVIAIAGIFIFQIASFVYLYSTLIDVKKKVDHRYFLTKESLESIHKVRIENGKIVTDFKK